MLLIKLLHTISFQRMKNISMKLRDLLMPIPNVNCLICFYARLFGLQYSFHCKI